MRLSHGPHVKAVGHNISDKKSSTVRELKKLPDPLAEGVETDLPVNVIINTDEPLNRLITKAAKTKILFVCTANIQRSLTAEHYCKPLYPSMTFKSAGVSRKECERNGSTLCTVELLKWADQVFVFEQKHIDRIIEYTGDRFVEKIHNLEIDDCYEYMQKELIEKLQSGLIRYL
jgi:predicted protein tyrosine phosphatase